MSQRATINNDDQVLIGQSEDAATVIRRSSRSFSNQSLGSLRLVPKCR
jgi:hypothetical protein